VVPLAVSFFLAGELADSVKFGLAQHCHINTHCRRPFSGIRLSPNFLSFHHFSLNMELLWRIRHCVVTEEGERAKRAERKKGREGRPRRAQSTKERELPCSSSRISALIE